MASADLAPARTPIDMFGDPIDDTIPLWFQKDLFLSPDFDSESYITDLRTFVPFDTLRSLLQSHLSSLKNELIELINRDYNDFVNLSGKLVDVDATIARMRAPLTDLRDKIVAFRGCVESSLLSLKNGLRQRSEAADVREVLELLLDTFHVVSKVEKLIKELPSVPSDWSNREANDTDQGYVANGVASQPAEKGSNVRETQSILLERIGSEMHRLKFNMAHAKDLPFVENMEKRIQSASLLLEASLGHCFVDGLEHRDVNVIYNCLRAYAAIDNTRNAEEFFRTKMVAPLIEKVIPNSPADAGETSCNELADDFVQIKQYVAKEWKYLLEISSTENSGLHVFDFLANSILKEALSAIQKGKPGALSPGRPTEFLRNYKASLDFLTYLEGYCPSRSAVSKFRAEPVYLEFIKQWNVTFYISLRFQEIAGGLDSALASHALMPIQNSKPDGNSNQLLALKQSVILAESLKSCWSDDVLVISFSDKFLRLFLQLLSRYTNWLSLVISARPSGGATPGPGSEVAAFSQPDDLIYVIHDIHSMVSVVRGDFLQNVLQLLSSCPTTVQDLVKQSILQSAKSLEEQAPRVMTLIVEALVGKAVEDLKQLKGITATYRMTNKPLPVRHSPYVSVVLRPVKAILEGDRAARYLTKDLKNELLRGASFEITRCFYELASDLVTVTKRTVSSLQRLRQGAQRRVGASSDVSDQNISDTDKMCMQLFLDTQEYGRNLAALGVDAAEIEAYRSLWKCVAPADKQHQIIF